MSRRFYTFLLMVTISLLVLAACTTGSPPPAPDATDSVAESEVEEPKATEAPPEEEADTNAEANAGSGPRTFVVDPAASSASYVVEEEFFAGALAKLGINAGIKTVVGTTTQVDGQFEVDAASGTLSGATFEVNLTGLTTDQDRRDGWIQNKGPQLANFPIATFVANEVVGAPEGYTDGEEVTFQLVGELTVRDMTRPTTFDVTATLSGDTISGKATSEPMLLSDFGIEPPSFANTLTVADEFHVEVELTAVAQ